MNQPEIGGTPERARMMRERLDDAIAQVMDGRPWSAPRRKLRGESLSSRQAYFYDPETGSGLTVTQSRKHKFILGVEVATDEVTPTNQLVTWVNRKDLSSEYEAVMIYEDNEASVGVELTYRKGLETLSDTHELGYFYDHPATFPNPHIKSDPAAEYDILTHLIENRLHQSFTEQPTVG